MINNIKVGANCGVQAFDQLPVVEGSEVKKSDTVTEWDVIPGIYTTTVDPVTGDTVYAPITKVSYHTNLKMYNVTLDVCGYYSTCVTASEDHSLITLNPITLEYEKTKPVEALGRMVPRLRKMSENLNSNCTRYICLGTQQYLSYNLGVFLGTIVGDGWVDANNTCRIACDNEGFRNYLLDLLKDDTQGIPVNAPAEEFAYSSDVIKRISTKDAHRITVHLDKEVKQDLKRAIGHMAENKRIPQECLGASISHMIGVLVGLLDTDGSISHGKPAVGKNTSSKSIAYHTTSPELRDSIQTLCARLGIDTSVRAYRGPNSTMDCYMITLSVPDVARVASDNPDTFRLHVSYKQEALERIIEDCKDNLKAEQFNIVPYPKAIWDIVSWTKVGSSMQGMLSVLSKCKDKGYMKRKDAQLLIKSFKDNAIDFTQYKQTHNGKKWGCPNVTGDAAEQLINKWIYLVEQDTLSWKYISSVEESSITDGWDCTVPGPYTFSTWEGVVVQDTTNIHVPVSDDAVKEVFDKMLPQRNLISIRKNAINYPLEKEYRQGVYLATRMESKDKPKVFANKQEAIRAYNRNEIDIDTPIEIQQQ